jgi:putative transposase
MPKQIFSTEEIIHKLREADVMSGQGKTVAEVCKQLGITDKTYFRWRKSHGGLRIDQAKRMKELETENARLKKAVAELTIDKIILKEVAEGKFSAQRIGAGGSEAVYGGRSRSHSYCARNNLLKFLSCRRISTGQDLCHHFASRHVQKGIPLKMVRDLLGHSSVTMSSRFAHPAPDQRREAVAKLD